MQMTNSRTTPPLLWKRGKAWVDLYVQSISSTNADLKIAAIACLMFGLELYLKSYIALRDNEYMEDDKLRGLGHEFKSLLNEYKKYAPRDQASNLEDMLKKYNLFDINIIELRYPMADCCWGFNEELYKGQHGFNDIFHYIDAQIPTYGAK